MPKIELLILLARLSKQCSHCTIIPSASYFIRRVSPHSVSVRQTAVGKFPVVQLDTNQRINPPSGVGIADLLLAGPALLFPVKACVERMAQRFWAVAVPAPIRNSHKTRGMFFMRKSFRVFSKNFHKAKPLLWKSIEKALRHCYPRMLYHRSVLHFGNALVAVGALRQGWVAFHEDAFPEAAAVVGDLLHGKSSIAARRRLVPSPPKLHQGPKADQQKIATRNVRRRSPFIPT